MKVTRFFYVFLLLGLSTLLRAQPSQAPQLPGKNKIGFDLLSAVWGRVPLTSEWGLIYNRTVSPKTEISTKLAYSDLNLFFKRAPLDSGGRLRDSVGVNGFGLGASVQHFFNPAIKNKWFTGLECNYTYTHFKDKNGQEDPFKLSKLTTSLIFGYRFHFFPDNMELDAFIGFGAAIRNFDWKRTEDDSSKQPNNGQTVNASWRVGWGLVLESSIAYAIPMGIRLGYRF